LQLIQFRFNKSKGEQSVARFFAEGANKSWSSIWNVPKFLMVWNVIALIEQMRAKECRSECEEKPSLESVFHGLAHGVLNATLVVRRSRFVSLKKSRAVVSVIGFHFAQ
jgi:hypothetical protein